MNEVISPEDWQWTINVAKKWKGRQRSNYGTIYDDEIESAAMMGLLTAVNKKRDDRLIITDWRGFLNLEIERSIIHELRRCTKSRMKKEKKVGYTNPFSWPIGVPDGENLEAYDETDYFGDFIKLEEKQKVNNELAGLDPKCREVMRRYFWEGQFYEEIGKYLGGSRMLAFRMIEKGKNQLKEKLECLC